MGWRIPFLVSVILLMFSVYIQLGLNESPIFQKMKEEGEGSKALTTESSKSACLPQGCSHKGHTAVVVGGTAKAAAVDKFAGLPVQGGESRRISQGDVFIMPPESIHWYKDVATPLRNIEVPVPQLCPAAIGLVDSPNTDFLGG